MSASDDFDKTRGTLETVDGRQALRFERRLPHRPERVWRAVTEPAEMARWFVAVAPWTPVAGETFEAYGQTGTVTALEPPSSGRSSKLYRSAPHSQAIRLGGSRAVNVPVCP